MIQLEKDEKILYTARRHWFVFLADIVTIIFACILVPFILFGAYIMVNDNVTIAGDISALFIAAGALLFLLFWTGIFVVWTDFFLDVVILTDRQVIDIEQRGLFRREISATRIDKIQDVTSDVDGVIQTFFKFGTIHIENASEDQDFIIRGIPNPFDLRQKISKQQSIVFKQRQTVHLSEDFLKKMDAKMPPTTPTTHT